MNRDLPDLKANDEQSKQLFKRLQQIAESEDVVQDMYAVAKQPTTKDEVFRRRLDKYNPVLKELEEARKNRMALYGDIEKWAAVLVTEDQAAAQCPERAAVLVPLIDVVLQAP